MRIVVRDLCKTFRDGRGQVVRAVDHLSLEVDDGELLVILGPSGSGKTTLLRCIAGLERADSGEITVDGRVVYSSERTAWVPPEQRGISMVFQTYALWPHMTAFENVAYPLRTKGAPARAIQERVATALELVGCGSLEGRHPSELSGGQQQRVAIARAIVGGSRVVLFDEPLSSVDARVREELRSELVTLQGELGFSSVYITHDQTEAMVIGHRVAVLSDGRIAQIAPPRELYGFPVSADVAEFMGATNQFPGTVVSRDDQSWRVRTEFGQFVAARTPRDPEEAATVNLIVRPEDFRLLRAAPGEPAANSWECSVQRSMFLGFCTEYVLRVNGQVVTARCAEKAVVADGAAAWLTVAPSDVCVVAAP